MGIGCLVHDVLYRRDRLVELLGLADVRVVVRARRLVCRRECGRQRGRRVLRSHDVLERLQLVRGRGVGEELLVAVDRRLGADPLAEVLWRAAREHCDVDACAASELVLGALEREHAGEAGRHVRTREVTRHPFAEVEEVAVDVEEEVARGRRVGGQGVDLAPHLRDVVEPAVGGAQRDRACRRQVGVGERLLVPSERAHRSIGLRPGRRQQVGRLALARDVPRRHDTFVLDGAAGLVERAQRCRELSVLLLGVERGESVAQPRGRHHDEREERHEQDEQQLRPEAQSRQHLHPPIDGHLAVSAGLRGRLRKEEGKNRFAGVRPGRRGPRAPRRSSAPNGPWSPRTGPRSRGAP